MAFHDDPNLPSTSTGIYHHAHDEEENFISEGSEPQTVRNSEDPQSQGFPLPTECHEEEAQDPFILEFREMKLNGEFPCKLCPKVFPNLRALKGHNKEHLKVPIGQPFPCNLCSFTSLRKSTMLEHMSSHNGDRPYECGDCRTTFTTKANCERHLRNQHGLTDQREIQSYVRYTDGSSKAKEKTGYRMLPKWRAPLVVNQEKYTGSVLSTSVAEESVHIPDYLTITTLDDSHDLIVPIEYLYPEVIWNEPLNEPLNLCTTSMSMEDQTDEPLNLARDSSHPAGTAGPSCSSAPAETPDTPMEINSEWHGNCVDYGINVGYLAQVLLVNAVMQSPPTDYERMDVREDNE